jgi:hypothetical protein
MRTLTTLAGIALIAAPALRAQANLRREPLEADRPDFTESSQLVPRGRVQLEAGFTLTHDRGGPVSTGQTYPEALLRIGMLAPWFEARIAQTLRSTRAGGDGAAAHTLRGADDLYVGAKFALGAQSHLRPEAALVLQTTLPTGKREIGAHGAMPGVNLLYGWDVGTGPLSVGGSTQGNSASNDRGERYVEFAQSITVGWELSSRIGMYGETYVIAPAGRAATGIPATQYVNGGFRVRINPDLQYDMRIGRGLNGPADDLFVGVGLTVRR